MPRNFLLLFNIVLLVVLNLLFGEPVKVTQTLPDSAKPGEEFEVTVSVEKGSISSFAKIQIDLPEGMTASAVESAGASFTFNDQTIKFIWMTLPEDATFELKYKITVAETIERKAYPLEGKFSYIEENERRTYNIPSHTVDVSDQAAVADAPPAEFIAPEGARVIQPLGDGTYKVTITIQKNSVTGFGKMQDQLIEGMQASPMNKNGASWTFVGNRPKFVWMNVPEQDEFSVSYKVTAGAALVGQLESISGDFSYLQNEQTKKARIRTTMNDATATIDEPVDEPVDEPTDDSRTDIPDEPDTPDDKIVDEPTPTPTPTPDPPKNTPDDTAKNTPDPEDDKPVDKPDDTSADLIEKITGTPAPSRGVNYRVQVCAGHRTVKDSYFKAVYKYEETPIMTENHEGWIKYLVGSYNQYREARDRRNSVTSGYAFPGPFVTAYNGGDRITVQEALMISGQKWVK